MGPYVHGVFAPVTIGCPLVTQPHQTLNRLGHLRTIDETREETTEGLSKGYRETSCSEVSPLSCGFCARDSVFIPIYGVTPLAVLDKQTEASWPDSSAQR